MSSGNRLVRWILAVSIPLMAARPAGAQSPSPLLLAVLGADRSIAIIDPTSRKVVGYAPTDNDPHTVAVSADGKLAFTGNSAGSTISVIDVATRKELRRVPVGQGASPSRVLYASGKVYFSAGGYKGIGRYDPATDKIDWYVGTGHDTSYLVISKDRDKIFVSDRNGNTVSIIEGVLAGPPKWTVTTIPVGGSAEGLDVSPDGKEVWAAKRFGGGISIIDVATKKLTQLDVPFGKNKATGSQATRVNFTPDGKRVILLHRPTEDIVIFDAATRKEIKRIKQTDADSMLVTSDGSRAYISCGGAAGGEGYVMAIDLKTLEMAGRIDIPAGPKIPCRGACDAFGLAWAGK